MSTPGKFAFSVFLLLFHVIVCKSQDFNEQYFNRLKIADALYKMQKYRDAAILYNRIFEENGDKAYVPDRYAAAKAWAKANNADSAFFHLFRIIERVKYNEVEKVENDSSFLSLHRHPRWKAALDNMIRNKREEEALIAILDSVFEDDQRYRLKVDETVARFGRESMAMKKLDSLISSADSINQIKVIGILDKYGWPGQYSIGSRGIAIFLVLQHADLSVQEKYLPQITAGVNAGDLDADKLALLEDRIAVKRGNCQTYGSQIGFDEKSKQHYVFPVFDPEHVDERRKEIGLEPIFDYAASWNIKWNKTKYRKEIRKLLGKKYLKDFECFND